MKKIIIKSVILLTISFILGIFFIGLNKSSTYNTKDLIGSKISKIQLIQLSENKIITEKELKNNDFTLINFWASWCGPCRDEHPYLLKLSNETKLKLLGVNFKDNKKNAKQFLDNLGNPYDYITTDNSGKQSINFGVYGIPESILIDKDLIIIKKIIGPINKKDFESIKKTIE